MSIGRRSPMRKGVGQIGSMIGSVCGGTSCWFGAHIFCGQRMCGVSTMVGVVIRTEHCGRTGIGLQGLQLLAMTVPSLSLSLSSAKM